MGLFNENAMDLHSDGRSPTTTEMAKKALNILDNNIDFSLIVLISSMLSFIFSYLTIKYFLIYVKRYSLDIFAYYRIFLALLLFIVIYS